MSEVAGKELTVRDSFRNYVAVFRKTWRIVIPLSVLAGVATGLVMLQKPNIYQATAVVTPAGEEGKQNPALGALASFGIVAGGPSRLEDLETLFKSNDLSLRIFRKYNLWPILFPDRYDPKTGTMKADWKDRLLGKAGKGKAPGDWDAIRAAKGRLKVLTNKRVGTVTLSFESPSPEGSAKIVTYYLEEGKSRLQEEALDRAVKNKRFIEEQISRTMDPPTRDRLYSLYSQEMEREMLARNREQFGFKIIDTVLPPDLKVGPRRGTAALLAVLFSLPALTVLFGFWVKKS